MTHIFRNFNFFLLFIALLINFNSASAQYSFSPIFESININQGHINDILKDSEGYIWVATQDGLAKYNGSQWLQLNHNRKDSFSIADNYVWTILEDDKGNIWSGTFEGNLCQYNKASNKFHCFSNQNKIGGVRLLYQINDDSLLVGTDKGIFFFNLKLEHYEYDSIFLASQFRAGLNNAYSLAEINSNSFLINSSEAYYLLSISDKKISKIEFNIPHSIPSGYIKKYNTQYLIADNNGVHVASYRQDKNEFVSAHYFYLAEQVGVTEILEIQDNLLLVASNSGLYTIDLTSNLTTFIANSDPTIKNGLDDKVVYCISEIEEDLFWLGTKTAIYEFTTAAKRFKQILSENLCNTSILGMKEDNEGNLWIATRKGLARIKNFHQTEDQWEYFCYNKSNVTGLRNEYLLNVMFVEGELYIGYRRMGMAHFKVDEQDKLVLLPIDKHLDSLTRNWSVSQMEQDSEGNVWIATSGNGVIKWLFPKNIFVHITKQEDKQYSLDHLYIFDFEELRKGQMSVATAGGISVIDIESIKINNYRDNGDDENTLNGNFVMDFHKDADGNIWVCTSSGLNIWNDDNTFTSWSMPDGLPNDVIYGMESKNGNRWISTNKGIVKVNYDENKKVNFRSFDEKDGILNNEHNQFSHYQSKSGLFFFGGKDGLTYFDPLKITDNNIKAIPKIESFKLFNEDASHLLEQKITYTDKIILKHNQNFLSFDLAALSYKNPKQNKFQYKMEGLSNEWFSLEDRNYLSFNGLSPGNYTLFIKAANNDGVWNEAARQLNIIIKKPIWNRWYAWLFYFSIVAAIVSYIYLMKVNSIRKIAAAKEEERNKIRERSARDFHDEAGTIITKLSLLTQYLQVSQNVESKDAKVLSQLEENIQKLRSGMRDFIWVLDPSKDSLKSTVAKLNEMANDLFEHSSINYSLITEIENSETIELESNQRRQLVLILKEGMNNVLKHSKAKNCTLKISNNKDEVSFILEDNGIGLDLHQLKKGNGLNNFQERARKINAKFSIDSILHQKTKISLIIPIHPNGL